MTDHQIIITCGFFPVKKCRLGLVLSSRWTPSILRIGEASLAQVNATRKGRFVPRPRAQLYSVAIKHSRHTSFPSRPFARMYFFLSAGWLSVELLSGCDDVSMYACMLGTFVDQGLTLESPSWLLLDLVRNSPFPLQLGWLTSEPSEGISLSLPSSTSTQVTGICCHNWLLIGSWGLNVGLHAWAVSTSHCAISVGLTL